MHTKVAATNGTARIAIPYKSEGVLLVNVSLYTIPSTTEQSLYIVGISKNDPKTRFDKIFGSIDYIKEISQSDGMLTFEFFKKSILCRIVFFGE